jgi:hypothetical protein
MKNLVLIVVLIFMSGCSFMVKTPIVANYENFEKISDYPKKNEISLLLGTPQGEGIHIYNGTSKELLFYYGFAGKFTLSTAQYDSGTAFISYDSERPVDFTYFTSKASGPEISFTKNLSIEALSGALKLGESRIENIYNVLGQPDYLGKRINYENDINNKVAFWDSSKIETKGAIKEKWILIGYDKFGITQDLVWVSSSKDDIKEFGKVSESQVKQLSRIKFVDIIPILDPTAMSTGTKIDPIQVDALIKTSPKNVKEIIEVIGLPTALGIKSYDGDEPMTLSNWSFSVVEMKGKEHNYIPPGANDEEKEKLRQGASYMVMNVDQSRLIFNP